MRQLDLAPRSKVLGYGSLKILWVARMSLAKFIVAYALTRGPVFLGILTISIEKQVEVEFRSTSVMSLTQSGPWLQQQQIRPRPHWLGYRVG